jgi:predicted nuclease of restriction endonuclease-like (RecB) superfamily
MEQTVKYENLVIAIKELLQANRQKVYVTINQTVTLTYWQIGEYIVEYEQKGEDRAKYGLSLLDNLSKDLETHFGKGFSVRNLRLFRQFYQTFPIWQSLIAETSESIQQSVNAKTSIVYEAFKQIAWTHLVRLLSIKNENERNFYIIETVNNNWTVRELNRQINSGLFERLLINKNEDKINEIINLGHKLNQPEDLIKDPYVLEFLGLKDHFTFSESDLESAIIENLSSFLLELGKGFSFVSRQYRISSNDEHYFIDLVFYNRFLKCHVLIDLKIGKLKHQDIGQMQMYVNYFDRVIRLAHENPTVGIVLCKEKNDFVIEYSLPVNNQQIFAKEFQLYFPDKNQLNKILKKYI